MYFVLLCITPCTQVGHPHKSQPAEPPKKQEKKSESISADGPSDLTYLLRRVESEGVSGGGGSATARRRWQLGSCAAAVAASAAVAAAHQRDVCRSLAGAAASAAVAAAQSAAAVHSATVRMRAAAIQVFHLWFLNSCN